MEIDLFDLGILEWPEEWRPVKRWEGIYEVSNKGRVRRLITRWGRTLETPYVLKRKHDGGGYPQVSLSFRGKIKYYHVHRLVAEAFIPNTDNLPEVNHKDEDKENNTIENLEWCTHKYNQNYGTKLLRTAIKKGHSVNKYDMDGRFIRKYHSVCSAAKDVNSKDPMTIIKCCRGLFKQAYGYKWSYAK